MKNFELRRACNDLIGELKNSVNKKNVIKVSIDIQLPERYLGSASQIYDSLYMLANYLSRQLVNGIIDIDISQRSHHHNIVMVDLQVTGHGSVQSGVSETELFSLLKNSPLEIEYRLSEDQLIFEYTQTLQEAYRNGLKSSLPFNNKKILIAEDNEINAMVFTSFLDEWGCENAVAVNGAEAVSHAHDGKFDAILMDIHMPVLNGNEATRKIREFSNIPIIALTASTQESDIKEAMHAGCSDYLLKPVSSTHLYQVLSKYL